MRFGLRLAQAALIVPASLLASTIGVVKAKSSAYENERRRVYEKPLFVVDKNEVIEVVRRGSILTKIRTKSGRTGWIETSSIDTTARPPILQVYSPEDNAPEATAEDDSAAIRAWMKANEGASKPASPIAPAVGQPASEGPMQCQKPLDFSNPAPHIPNQSRGDTVPPPAKP